MTKKIGDETNFTSPPSGGLGGAAMRMFDSQLAEWPLAAQNYAALKNVQTKDFNFGQFLIRVQFNPARIQSSAAKVDSKSIQERKCFLCPANLPPEQRGIPFGCDYQILVNPFPIFPVHLTIPSLNHIDQLIFDRYEDMLDLAKNLDEFVIFYNGPKCGASAPDHVHFQAGNKGFLPLEKDIKNVSKDIILENDTTKIYSLKNYLRNIIVVESDEKNELVKAFNNIYSQLEIKDSEREPMLNIISWYEYGKYISCIFPRTAHRPECFFAEGDKNILISPASVDMGGVFIIPQEKDFEKITKEDITKILEETAPLNPPSGGGFSVSEASNRNIGNETNSVPPLQTRKYSVVPLPVERVPEGRVRLRGLGGEVVSCKVGILSSKNINFILNNDYFFQNENVIGENTVSFESGKIRWNGNLYNEILFEAGTNNSSFTLKDVTIGINFHWERKEDQRFQGSLKFIIENEQLTAINIIDVEDYLTSVISSEMSATASLELLKAHTVISRSWLLAQIAAPPSPPEGGDVPFSKASNANFLTLDSSNADVQTSKASNADSQTSAKDYKCLTAKHTNYELLKQFSKEKRCFSTEAESALWEMLRRKNLDIRFRRQHIIDDFIVDFVCLKKKLIIEMDGKYHNQPETQIADELRTEILENLGYNVLRFTNEEVLANTDSVLQTIKGALEKNIVNDANFTSPPSGGLGGATIIRWYDREDHANFDVCADDHCQRYQGISRAFENIEQVKKAVESTRGQILMYEGEVCDARFSKCCGGAVEEFQNCWEDTKYPYLEKLRDAENSKDIPDLSLEKESLKWIKERPAAFCNTTDKKILSQVLNNYDQETTDFYRWSVAYSQKELSELAKERSGIDFGDILDLIPIERGTSGRIVKLKIVGTKRCMIIGKELEIRRTLSKSHLYSSAFYVEKKDGNFILHGAGWGHGVGLCQIGAAVMGEKGYKYDEILRHYYPNSEIKKKY